MSHAPARWRPPCRPGRRRRPARRSAGRRRRPARARPPRSRAPRTRAPGPAACRRMPCFRDACGQGGDCTLKGSGSTPGRLLARPRDGPESDHGPDQTRDLAPGEGACPLTHHAILLCARHGAAGPHSVLLVSCMPAAGLSPAGTCFGSCREAGCWPAPAARLGWPQHLPPCPCSPRSHTRGRTRPRSAARGAQGTRSGQSAPSVAVGRRVHHVPHQGRWLPGDVSLPELVQLPLGFRPLCRPPGVLPRLQARTLDS